MSNWDQPQNFGDASNVSSGVSGRTEYAGFWLRVAAIIIDGIILNIVNSILMFIFAPNLMSLFVMDPEMSEADQMAMIATAMSSLGVYTLVSTLVTCGYFAYMHSSERQATLGKMAVGIKVTDLDGNRISLGRAIGRYFAQILSGITMGIGYIMAGFTEKKQALHDIVCSTLVVKAK